MAALAIILALFMAGLVVYMIWARPVPETYEYEPAPTEAELLQARLYIHRIERGVDVALAKQEQRREAERVRQAIAEALEEDQP